MKACLLRSPAAIETNPLAFADVKTPEPGKGEVLVRVRVWTPTHLTSEQKALLEQLANVESAPPSDAGSGRKFWEELRRAFGA